MLQFYIGRIPGSHKEPAAQAEPSAEAENATEKTRAQIVANYVAANNLSVTAIQDYGWDPQTLPEENIDSFYSTLD